LDGAHQLSGQAGHDHAPFVHEALYYRGDGDFLTGTVRFVRAALAMGDSVLVAVPEPRLSLLRSELADVDGAVRYVNMAEAGRNPNRILPWVLRAFLEEQSPRRVSIIGEPIYVGRSAEEIAPCVQHEALINVAFSGIDATILCPYDVAALADIVPYAEGTHPVVIEDGGRRASVSYTEPHTVVATLNRPLPEPRRVDAVLDFDAEGLAGVRRLIGKHADDAGLAERSVDLQLAVTEVGTNAVTHAGARAGATLRLWREADRVVCEVRGAGEIVDIMAGRIVPAPDGPRARGLLIANRLCDLVQTYTMPAGTNTRLHMRL